MPSFPVLSDMPLPDILIHFSYYLIPKRLCREAAMRNSRRRFLICNQGDLFSLRNKSPCEKYAIKHIFHTNLHSAGILIRLNNLKITLTLKIVYRAEKITSRRKIKNFMLILHTFHTKRIAGQTVSHLQ